MKSHKFRELDVELENLILVAEEAAAHVYPRDRDVAIGAALASGNKIYLGANIGRRAFNNSTCAERMALDKALFDGIDKIDRIVVIGLNKTQPFDEVISPCGACRQILFEAISRLNQEDVELVLSNSSKTKIIRTTLCELLPLVYENAKRE